MVGAVAESLSPKSARGARSVLDHAADRFALVHEVEGFAEPLKRHHVSYQIVDVDLALHVPVDDLRHVAAALGTAKGSTLPGPARDQLKRPRRDFLAGAGHSDDHARPPSSLAALERLAHQLHITDAFKGEVSAAAG